jgi:hypothetical protein
MNQRVRMAIDVPVMAKIRPLLHVIDSLWPVDFVDRSAVGPTGTIVDAASRGDLPARWRLEVAGTDSSDGSKPVARTEVGFADDPAVPWPYRGRRFDAPIRVSNRPLAAAQGQRILASTFDGRPLWTVEHAEGRTIHRSAFTLPTIGDGDVTRAASGDQFIHVLPLFQVVREACGALAHEAPPLRAAFIVDDPNLHWPRYGFADYRAIARQAAEERYHVAFATIPFDAWFTHRRSAAIFREHAEQMSLLIHGNDHGRNELAQSRSAEESTALLDQALTRISVLERKSGLRVCRVMVPPHGACSESMLERLAACGFESACLSTGSLRAHNASRPWVRTLGFAPSETVRGCTVLPRWSLTATGKDVLLAAAYLGQPLILRAHHQDLKNGLDVFAQAARFVNSLGPVQWSNLTSIGRLNYRWRRAGSALRVQPFGPSVDLDVPAWAARVVVEAAGVSTTVSGTDGELARIDAHAEGSIEVVPGTRLHLAPDLPREPRTPALNRKARRTSVRLVARRLLTEARDRLLFA